MANVSGAWGTMYISSKKKEDVEWLVKMINEHLPAGEYSTYLNDEGTYHEAENGWECEVSFVGNGRWTYLTNIEFMVAWLKVEMSESEKEKLERLDFVVAFDYMDEECGCEVLEQVNARVIHSNGKSEFVVDDTVTYEYTMENLLKFGVYDECEFEEGEILDYLNPEIQKKKLDVRLIDVINKVSERTLEHQDRPLHPNSHAYPFRRPVELVDFYRKSLYYHLNDLAPGSFYVNSSYIDINIVPVVDGIAVYEKEVLLKIHRYEPSSGWCRLKSVEFIKADEHEKTIGELLNEAKEAYNNKLERERNKKGELEQAFKEALKKEGLNEVGFRYLMWCWNKLDRQQQKAFLGD